MLLWRSLVMGSLPLPEPEYLGQSCCLSACMFLSIWPFCLLGWCRRLSAADCRIHSFLSSCIHSKGICVEPLGPWCVCHAVCQLGLCAPGPCRLGGSLSSSWGSPQSMDLTRCRTVRLGRLHPLPVPLGPHIGPVVIWRYGSSWCCVRGGGSGSLLPLLGVLVVFVQLVYDWRAVVVRLPCVVQCPLPVLQVLYSAVLLVHRRLRQAHPCWLMIFFLRCSLPCPSWQVLPRVRWGWQRLAFCVAVALQRLPSPREVLGFLLLLP